MEGERGEEEEVPRWSEKKAMRHVSKNSNHDA